MQLTLCNAVDPSAMGRNDGRWSRCCHSGLLCSLSHKSSLSSSSSSLFTPPVIIMMIKINIGMIFQSSFQYCPTINFPHGRRPNQSMISKNAFSICISTWKHLTKTFLQQMHCCKMFLYPRGKMEEKQRNYALIFIKIFIYFV